jgi:hypothetical protein
VQLKKEKRRKCFAVDYGLSAVLPLTHHEPPLKLYFAFTGHLPHTQPAFFTVSFALPTEQKNPPLNGEPLKVGHLPQIHMLAFSGVFGTVTPIDFHLKSVLVELFF